MSFVRQFFALLSMGLGSLPQRVGSAFVIFVGTACVVGVLVSMLAMGVGARRQAMGNMRPDRVVLRSTGSTSFGDSSIARDQAQIVRNMAGIRKGAAGEPIAVFETLVIVEARRKSNNSRVNFPLFGVSPGLLDLQPETRITAGRMFQPGLHELIVSESRAAQYQGFELGDQRDIRGSQWTVVGHFTEGTGDGPSTMYADADTVLSAFGRNSFNQLYLMLESPAGYDAFATALKDNPALKIDIKHEADVMNEVSKGFTGILDFVSYFVGTIMAIGATLGAVNSLYAIVDSRRRELATLRAIGYGSTPIVASVLVESLLLSLPGALLGAALAWLCFNGLSASPFGVSFHLAVTLPLAGFGILWAAAMALVGGLPPALRAARVPVATALRAS